VDRKNENFGTEQQIFLSMMIREFIALEGIARDITERKRAEEKLLESENKFRLVWEKSTDGMRITNEEGIILLVNDAYCKLVEKPHHEIEGQPMSVVQDSTRQNEILLKHKQRFRSRNVPGYLEKKITLWNGTEKYLELSNTFIEIANQPALLLPFLGMTKRKRARKNCAKAKTLRVVETQRSYLHAYWMEIYSVNKALRIYAYF